MVLEYLSKFKQIFFAKSNKLFKLKKLVQTKKYLNDILI